MSCPQLHFPGTDSLPRSHAKTQFGFSRPNVDIEFQRTKRCVTTLALACLPYCRAYS